MFNKLLVILSLIIVTAVTVEINAREAKSEKQAATAVKYRKAVLNLIRSNMGPMIPMMKGEIPYNVDVMKKNGERLEQLATMMPDYFVMDTRKFDIKTEALPKLWDNKDDFGMKAGALLDAAKALRAAAASGDDSGYGKAIRGVLKTCKGCHDNYKAE